MDYGYILLSRKLESSEIFQRKPLEWGRIWLHLLLNVNYVSGSPTKGLPRGAGYFSWQTSRARLHGVSENQWQKCLIWCRENKMIETIKRPRGLEIAVIQYHVYQDQSTYAREGSAVAEPAAPDLPPAAPRAARRKSPPTLAPAEYPAAFLAIWNPWPRHTQQKDAYAEYVKAIKRTTPDTIAAGAARTLAAVAAGLLEARYVPELFRWLRKDRWTDQYQTPTAPKTSKPPGEVRRRQDMRDDLVASLYDSRDNSDEFGRLLRVARDKFRDIPRNADGEHLVDEALRVFRENMEFAKSRQGPQI